LDLVTAIKVSVEFGREAYNVVFGLTLCLILVPLFLVSVLSTVQTFQHPLAFETVARQLDFKDLGLYLLPVLSTIFPRFVQEFMLWKRSYLKNSPACANYEACHCMRCIQYREFNKSRNDFLWIHYIHAILSSAPRYCLQVYIVLRQWNFPLYTAVSVVLSLLYLSWSITVLEKASATEESRDFRPQAAVVFFIYQLLTLLSRLLAIVIFAYVFKSSIFLVLILHWLMISGVLLCTDYRCHVCVDGSYDCIKGFLLSFLSSIPFLFHSSKVVLKSLGIYSHTLYHTLYAVIFVENFILTIVAVFVIRPDVAHLSAVGPIAMFFVTTVPVLGAICYQPLNEHLPFTNL
jgi:hypothetical protein